MTWKVIISIILFTIERIDRRTKAVLSPFYISVTMLLMTPWDVFRCIVVNFISNLYSNTFDSNILLIMKLFIILNIKKNAKIFEKNKQTFNLQN